MSKLEGIDVSRWQNVINWDQVKANKQFAIIKVGGSDQGMYTDGRAVRNVQEARRVGIPRGFYFYLGGVYSPAAELQHIKNVIAEIGGLQPGESVTLDWEESHPSEVDYVHDIAKGLIDSGFPPPLIYMSLSRVRGHDWKRVVNLNCGLWVAAWGDNDAVPETHEIPGSDEWPFWAIWQYSSTGTVPGIGTRVDLNQFAGDVEAFNKYGAPGAINPPAPEPAPAPKPPVSTGEYTVQPGDTLSGIGAKYGVSWQTIFAMNGDRISNPNRIFPGQVLRVPGSAAPAPPAKTYTVREGDSLSSIASRFGTTWQRIYELNKATIGSNPNLIKPGQVLKLP